MPNPKNTNIIIVLLLGAILALLGRQSFGVRPPPPGPTAPGIIATFDLETTFNALSEKKASDSALLTMANNLNTTGIEKGKEIKQMEADLEDHLKGSPAYKQLLSQYTLKSFEYRAYIDFCKAKVDVERARTLKRIYTDIRKAVALIAAANNYVIVFVDDSVSEIPVGNEEETNRQISARRMVYTSPTVDITPAIISAMNAEFVAAGGVVPPPPAPVPPPTASSSSPTPPPAAGAKTP